MGTGPRRRRRGWPAYSVASVPLLVSMLLAALLAPAATPATDLAPVAAAPLYSSVSGVRNVSFIYDRASSLAPGVDLSNLGHPAVVVSGRPTDEAAAVAAIHARGARAFRYVQFYWVPDDKPLEGIDLRLHPDWAFCESGDKPSLGRVTDAGTRHWYFLDTNEAPVRARIHTVLASLRAAGWDGVMFDRGEAATQYAVDAAGTQLWAKESTCTGRPYRAGLRFADSYVRMLALAHTVGLQTMLNTGKSAFDPIAPMRPDPRDAACRTHDWAHCHHLLDAWPALDLVLNESATQLEDRRWERTFTGNSRAEHDATYGHRTVALITSANLGGVANQTRANVFYAWSRIKLFDLPVAINTGDGGCAPGSTICNHFGHYAELVDTLFGPPLATMPVSQACTVGSKIRCVWLRRYTRGMDVVNAQPSAQTVSIKLGTATCRYVLNVNSKRPLMGNTCVSTVRLSMPAWSGRPLKYSRTPW